ncbi:MAG: tetratricopeptide repeat protein [Deltaproteobacteria bacterium]|nr:tetratricopeptide repeat protein [Deltaproteobacteria bacterium]
MIDVPRDDMVLLLEAGYLYLAMGKYAEARQVFEGVSVLAPKHEVPRVGLGNVLFAQKKFLPAIRVLKDALELRPDSAFAHAHLGEALLFYGKKDEALKELKNAAEIEPKGKAGDFARSLTELVNMGYDPVKLKKESPKKASGKGA